MKDSLKISGSCVFLLIGLLTGNSASAQDKTVKDGVFEDVSY